LPLPDPLHLYSLCPLLLALSLTASRLPPSPACLPRLQADGAFGPPPKKLKQATIKFKICPKEITTADATALYASLPSLPDLTAQNAHGRFVVAPPAMWPDDACPDSAGFMGKITKSVTVRGQGVVLTIKFKDKTQHMSLSAVQGWKCVS
jgi:hypothetical protein